MLIAEMTWRGLRVTVSAGEGALRRYALEVENAVDLRNTINIKLSGKVEVTHEVGNRNENVIEDTLNVGLSQNHYE